MADNAKDNPGDGLLAPGEVGNLNVYVQEGENAGHALARMTLDPKTRNASLAIAFGSKGFGEQYKRPDLAESASALEDEIQLASNGDLSLASRMHTSQAVTLDAVFTEMARRAALNLGQYPDAAERYMRLALKAQSACRSTLEALAKLHQPREQIVKHIHVSDGGQAVVADRFHQHMGGQELGKSVKQSDATRTAGQIAALPRQDASGNGVPITGSEREAAMQDAWRNESGGT